MGLRGQQANPIDTASQSGHGASSRQEGRSVTLAGRRPHPGEASVSCLAMGAKKTPRPPPHRPDFVPERYAGVPPPASLRGRSRSRGATRRRAIADKSRRCRGRGPPRYGSDAPRRGDRVVRQISLPGSPVVDRTDIHERRSRAKKTPKNNGTCGRGWRNAIAHRRTRTGSSPDRVGSAESARIKAPRSGRGRAVGLRLCPGRDNPGSRSREGGCWAVARRRRDPDRRSR